MNLDIEPEAFRSTTNPSWSRQMLDSIELFPFCGAVESSPMLLALEEYVPCILLLLWCRYVDTLVFQLTTGIAAPLRLQPPPEEESAGTKPSNPERYLSLV